MNALRIAVALSFVLFVCPARAQTAAEGDRAEHLFYEASALVEAGRFAEACEKFAESQRLDPGIGTLYNLALCYERIGRLATAWRSFREVQDLAHAAGKEGRSSAARERAAALRPRLRYLVLRSPDPDAVVKVDGVEVARDQWSFVPLDPGDHRVEVTAAGKTPWSSTVTIAVNEGAGTEVVVPTLETPPTTPKVITITRETSPRRTIGFVLGGVGAAGVVAAAVTGIMLLDDRAIAREECNPKCSARGEDAVSEGETLLPVNAVAWGIAALGLGAGAYLVLTSPPRAASAKTAILPMFSEHAAGAIIRGAL